MKCMGVEIVYGKKAMRFIPPPYFDPFKHNESFPACTNVDQPILFTSEVDIEHKTVFRPRGSNISWCST